MSLREKLSELSIQPHDTIVEAIDNKTFPLSENKFFAHNPEHLASEEFKRCVSLFEKKMGAKITDKTLVFGSSGYNKAMGAQFKATSDIMSLESMHIKKLESIAERVIREMYDIPEDVDLQGFIEQPSKEDFDPQESQEQDAQEPWDEGTPLTDERKAEIEKEAQKRVILNSLSHGSSIHIWKSAYYIVKKEIEELNPKLVESYDEYASLTSILLWMFPAEFMKNAIESGGQIDQGYNKVDWGEEEEEESGDDEESFDDGMEEEYQKYLAEQEDVEEEGEESEENPTGMAIGVNFPVLLHELNKSVFEIMLMHSIPEDYTEEELMYYYSIADNYTEEIWHYFLGPTLWSSLFSVINETEHSVADTFMLFSNIDYDSLSNFCVLVVEDKEKAIGRLNLMAEMFDDE